MAENTVKWQRTSVQHLLIDRRSGKFYGRWTVSGKQIWRALLTDVFSVAKLRLADAAAEIEKLRVRGAGVAEGSATVGQLIGTYEARIAANSDLKPETIKSKLGATKRLLRTWPGIDRLEPRQITRAAVFAWAAKFKAEGTQFQPPGSKTVRRGNSATAVNSAIDALRHVLDLAVESGQIHANPVQPKLNGERLKKRIAKKALILPDRGQMNRLFAEMENNGSVGGHSHEAADLCRFMAYSGARIGEASEACWGDVDRARDMLRIRGTKTETSERTIPIFPDLSSLLDRIAERQNRPPHNGTVGTHRVSPKDRIFKIHECQRTIDGACKRLGIARVTHHDFRHCFATTCIECGVDIPTVSRWMGHNDGGALAMKTYGHLRQDHSKAQAQRVRFS